MEEKDPNEFYKKYGPYVHSDPERFLAIANLCGVNVLDIGCGTGDLADFYKGNYTGLDISSTAIENAKKIRRSDADFLVADVLDPKQDFGMTFDTIIMAEFLEHIEDDTIVFEKIKRWTHFGSRLIISVPNGDRVPDEDHVRQFTVPELRKKFSPLGRVKFHTWGGFYYRILMTVDIGQPNENRIALVSPVKNEGRGIERMILSCLDFVDQVVISVDTKSSDDTLNIAKRYADVLKQHEWQNSFAEARNFAQKDVLAKWILALDGHEYVEKHEFLEKALSSEVDGLFVKIFLEDGFSFWFPRIILNNIQWVKDIHNFPECEKMERYKNFLIIHDRPGGQSEQSAIERSSQRHKMVSEKLLKLLKEDKKDYRSAFYLGQQNLHENNLKKAIKYYKHYLKYSPNKEERWLACYTIAHCFNGLNKPKKGLKWLDKADQEIPGRWEVSKKRGSIFIFLKKWEKGIENLVESFNKDNSNCMFNPEPRNDSQTWYFISQAFIKLKKPYEARIALKRAKDAQGESKFTRLPKSEQKVIEELLEDTPV